MDYDKIGKLLLGLRREKGLTQKQLADLMGISDRTVSKWERGLGLPDVSLLHELSDILGVNIEQILTGDLRANRADGGNITRIRFYVCPTCGNFLTSSSDAKVSCCGRRLPALAPRASDDQHHLVLESVEEDYYITFPHEMNKDHYLKFIAHVSYDRVLLVWLYPEQGSEARFPKMYGGRLYFYCSRHGLWVNER